MASRRAVFVALTLASCSVDGITFTAGLPFDASPAPTVKTPEPLADAGLAESGGPVIVDASPERDTGTVPPDTGPPKPDPCAEDRLLVGNGSLSGLDDDDVTANEVVAFPYVAPAAVSARCFRINFQSVNTNLVSVGVYADSSGAPSSLIAAGSITSPVTGWNKTILDTTVTLSPGTRIWLAVIPKTVDVRIFLDQDCNGRRRHNGAAGTLPSTFGPASEEIYCNGAMFLSP